MSVARTQVEVVLRPWMLRRRALDAATGLLHGLALASALAVVALLMGGREALRGPAAAVGLPALVLMLALVRLLRPLPVMAAALAIERTFPWLQDRLATAVDLSSRRKRRAPASTRAIERVITEATAATRDLPLTRGLPLSVLRRPAATAVLAVVIAAVAWSALPERRLEPPAAPALLPVPDERSVPALPSIALTDLRLTIEPPTYTRLPARKWSDNLERVRVPAGSRVTIAGRCVGATSATLALEPGGTRELSPAGGGRLEHALTLITPLRWRLSASEGPTATATPWCSLEPVPDALPTVALLRPGGDLALERAEPVEVAVAAGDDYGVTALGLRYRLGEEGPWRTLALEATRGSASARLNPGALGLRPGGELTLRAYATDNDAVSGPKTALSAPVRITLRADGAANAEPPTPLAEAQQEQQDALEELRRAAQELGDELARALERAGEAGTDAGGVARELEQAARRLEEQAGRLEQARRAAEREITAAELVTPELAEKVRELHELMRAALNEEMRRALEELQRALAATDLEQMRMSLEQAREAQQRFMERLEQTLELLRRARLEGLVEQLRRQAEELAQRQHELGEQTEALRPGEDARGTEREQRTLARDTEPLAAQIEAAVEAAREVSAEAAARLGAIADRLIREDPAASMRQAASALGRSAPSSARGPQQEAEVSLAAASSALGELGKSLAQDFTAEARREVGELIRDTLALSGAQEGLTEDVARLLEAPLADLARDKRSIEPLRRRQTTLAEGARELATRMAELARKTPAMDPSLAAVAGVVAEEMAQTAREIEGADVVGASWRGRAAMAGLNEVARALLEVDEQLTGGSASSALQQWMEGLRSLAERQQALNERTGEARRQGQGAGQSLSQLAFEQELIRRALEQMLRQGGRETQPLADQLGGVPEEMEQVEDELRSGVAERRTIEHQEEILEKMLEAQRSLYTRDQEREERQAERPTTWTPPPSPPPLSPSLLRAPSVNMRSRSAQSELPRGYEDLVREYFRALGEGRP